MAAIGVFLLLCGWRLSTVFLVLLDDKRERVTYWDETPVTVLHYLLFRPRPGWMTTSTPRRRNFRRADLLCGTCRPVASRSQPGLRLAMVAHPDAGLLLARDGLAQVVSSELLACLTGRSSAQRTS